MIETQTLHSVGKLSNKVILPETIVTQPGIVPDVLILANDLTNFDQKLTQALNSLRNKK